MSGLSFFGGSANVTTKVCRFYLKGHGITIHDIEENNKIFRMVISKALASNTDVVTCNFKQHLDYFNLPLERGVDYPVYDICLTSSTGATDAATLEQVVTSVLERLSTIKLRPWQRVFANAAVVFPLTPLGTLVTVS